MNQSEGSPTLNIVYRFGRNRFLNNNVTSITFIYSVSVILSLSETPFMFDIKPVILCVGG